MAGVRWSRENWTVGCYLYIATESRMRARAEDGDPITDAVSSQMNLRRRQVAMVSWDGGSIHALALMTRTRSTLSFKTNFRLTHFCHVGEISLDSLAARLPLEDRARFDAVRDAGGALPDGIAAKLKIVFDGEEGEGPWQILEALAATTPAELWPEDRAPIVAYEREAVGLALSAAGLDRAPVMKLWDGNAEAPFLASLRGLVALEQTIIDHDARVFGDWSVIASGIVGATTFEQRGRRLTMVNVNHSKVEQTLGCDLIYYTHRYDAYVLVQYKRLRRGGEGWEYRPDKQLAIELERMRRITNQAKYSPQPSSHRLGEDFCFVKLCRPEVEDPYSLEMAEGMYFPLGLWDKLVDSEQLRGSKGGTVFTYENVDRYLTNTNIIGLIERSWMGSCGPTSEQIGDVIQNALAAGSSVMLAVEANPLPAPRRGSLRR
jgi:hypothetical protein